MATYLKQSPMYSPEVSEAVRTTVSEMLGRIERDGVDAVRAYSRELDGWDPKSFVATPSEIEAATGKIDGELREHIAFAQEQVRAFARAQRASLTDIEVQTRPGVTLGHRHVPVGSVGSYVPGGRYPMPASAFMTVIVPKVAGAARTGRARPHLTGDPHLDLGGHRQTGHRLRRSAPGDVADRGGRRPGVARAWIGGGSSPMTPRRWPSPTSTPPSIWRSR